MPLVHFAFIKFTKNMILISTCGSWEYCCGGAVDLGSNTPPALGSNTESKPGKLAIDDGGGTLTN